MNDNHTPLVHQDADRDYPTYSMVNWRNFLSAAALATAGGSAMVSGRAVPSGTPTEAPVALGGVQWTHP